MHAIIILTLSVLGANAYWDYSDYSDEWPKPPRNPPIPGEKRKPANYPSKSFPSIFSQSQSQQKSVIDTYVTEAEWVCNNPNTGDILILAPQKKDQTKKPADKPTIRTMFENGQSQESTTRSSTQTADKFQPPMRPHGGEGIINMRIGDV